MSTPREGKISRGIICNQALAEQLSVGSLYGLGVGGRFLISTEYLHLRDQCVRCTRGRVMYVPHVRRYAFSKRLRLGFDAGIFVGAFQFCNNTFSKNGLTKLIKYCLLLQITGWFPTDLDPACHEMYK